MNPAITEPLNVPKKTWNRAKRKKEYDENIVGSQTRKPNPERRSNE